MEDPLARLASVSAVLRCRAAGVTAGVTPGRGDGSAVLSRWQGPRPPTAGGL